MKRRGGLRLQRALREESLLRSHVRPGVRALAPKDAKLIAETERRRIGDSLNFDAATAVECPQEFRWDYLVSVPHASQIVGIEPHSAKDDEVSVVIAKKRHAAGYLRAHFVEGCRVKRWLWVSHGRVRFSNMERKRRLLDQAGIEFVGRGLQSLA